MDLLHILTAIITMGEKEVVIENTLPTAESFKVSKSMTVIKLGDTHQIRVEAAAQLEQVKVTNHPRMR